MKETKTIANRGISFNINNSGFNHKKDNFLTKEKVKFANLFESLPKFNNTLYKKSTNNNSFNPPLIASPKQNIKSQEGKTNSKTPKLPFIGNVEMSKAHESIRRSMDFCQNTTQISYLGNQFNSSVMTNNLSNMHFGSNNNSNRRTTLTFNIKNTNAKPKLSKNNSQIKLKNVSSYYAENFKSKYGLFKDLKKANNISDSGIQNKNTIIDKIGEYKKTNRDFANKHYLSTENFNQISPRRVNYDEIEVNADN